MSIKKLFDSQRSKNYLSETDEREAFADVESSRNVKANSNISLRHASAKMQEKL